MLLEQARRIPSQSMSRPACYFLLNYATRSTRAKRKLKKSLGELAIFFWIMPTNPLLLIAATMISHLAIFFWIMRASRHNLGKRSSVKQLAIFFWIMHAGKTRQRTILIPISCYFLLNYATTIATAVDRLERPCYFLLNYAFESMIRWNSSREKRLAIFFWIMPRCRMQHNWRME